MYNMNFKKPKDCLFMTGSTLRGNSISFVPISDERIIFYKPEDEGLIWEKKKDEETTIRKHTKIILYCNFTITTSMADLLENSKVIKVESFSNKTKQILLYPLYGFEFEKLTDILFDLSVKFNL